MLDAWLNKIHQGDCLELMRQLPDNSIDMIFTDPPYGHNNNNGDLIHNWEKALGVIDSSLPSTGCQNPGRPILNDGPEANDLFQAILPEFK